jgi:predicted MFS family arabinose efflux permease
MPQLYPSRRPLEPRFRDNAGLDTGAEYWVAFGLGPIVGPLLSGHLADRAGFDPALHLAFLVEAFAVALPAFSSGSV